MQTPTVGKRMIVTILTVAGFMAFHQFQWAAAVATAYICGQSATDIVKARNGKPKDAGARKEGVT